MTKYSNDSAMPPACEEYPAVSKLAARFGGGTVARQAARKALVNRTRQQLAEANGTSFASPSQNVGNHSPAHSNQNTPQPSGTGVQHRKARNNAADASRQPPASDASAVAKQDSSNSSTPPAVAADAEMDELMGVMAALNGPKAAAADEVLAADCNDFIHSQTPQTMTAAAAVQQSADSTDGSPGEQHTVSDSSRMLKQSAGYNSTKPGSPRPGVCTPSAPHRVRPLSPKQTLKHQQQGVLHHTAEGLNQQQGSKQSNVILKPGQQQTADAASPRASATSSSHQQQYSSTHKIEHIGPQGKVQQGPAVTVKPAVFNFEDAHPALAGTHYLRTHEQNRLLAANKEQQSAAGSQAAQSTSPARHLILQLQQQLHQLQQQRPKSAAAAAAPPRRRNSHSGGGWHPSGPNDARSPHKRPQSASPGATRSPAAAAGGVGRQVHVLGPNLANFGPLDSVDGDVIVGDGGDGGDCNDSSRVRSAEAAAAAAAAAAAGSAAVVDPDGGSSSSRAVREEQLSLLRDAQKALTNSQHLRIRQNANVPVVASKSRGMGYSSRSSAAAAAGRDRRWRTAAEVEQQQQQQESGPDRQQTIEDLQQKMKCLQEGLAAVVANKPLPPVAAATLAAALQQSTQQAVGSAAAAAIGAGRSDHDEIQDLISVISQPGAYQDRGQQQQHREQQMHVSSSSSHAGVRDDPAAAAAAAAAAAGRDLDKKYELMLASGAFDPKRFEAYNRQLDVDMARRAAADDYDSDLEAEAEAVRAANGEAVDAMRELHEAEQRLQDLADEEQRLRATWSEQDQWMDEYRHYQDDRQQQQQQQQQQQPADSANDDADDEHEEDDQTDLPQQRQQLLPQGDLAAATNPAAAARGLAAADGTAAVAAARGHQAAAAAAVIRHHSPPRRVLTPADEALIRKPFVPLISQEYPEYAVMSDLNNNGITNHNMLRTGVTDSQGLASGYNSDGPVSYYSRTEGGMDLGSTTNSAAAAAGSSNRPRSASPFKTTLSRSFNFEQKAAMRPKSIAAVKMEQDLLIQQQGEEAHMHMRFIANPIPASTLEPRYQRIIGDQLDKRAAAHAKYTQLLSARESPFSFYCRDKAAAAAAKAAKAAAAKDPNRFQKPFKAKPVPSYVNESRYQAAVAGVEAAKLAARVKAELAREKATAKLQESYKKRQDLAEAAYRERLQHSKEASQRFTSPYSSPSKASAAANATSSMGNQGFGPQGTDGAAAAAGGGSRPATPGAGQRGISSHVPNFAVLHAEWEAQLAAKKAANKGRVTVPEEFFLDGGTPEEQAARKQKAAERKQRIIQQMEDDEHKLKELRWPYVSTRAGNNQTSSPTLTPWNQGLSTNVNLSSSGESRSAQLGMADASDAAGETEDDSDNDDESSWANESAAHRANGPRGVGTPTSAKRVSAPNRAPVVGETLSAQLRAKVVRQAMADGRYDSKEERDRKQWEAARQKQSRRQQQWQATHTAAAHKRPVQQQQQGYSSRPGGGVDGTAGQLDPEMAAAAGAAAAAAAGDSSNVSEAEVAAHLSNLLSGKAVQDSAPPPPAAAAAAAAERPSTSDHQTSAAADAAGSLESVRRPHTAGSESVRGDPSSYEAGMLRHSISSSRRSGSRRGAGGFASRSTVAQKRAGLSGRVDAPIMHIEARHAHAEKAARKMIEEALLEQGIEAYRYVKG